MSSFAIRRILQSVLVLLAVSLVVFFSVYAVGNPVELLVSPEASQAERDLLIARLGLDRPAWQQYMVFLGNMLHGDLGTSFVHGVPAMELIVSRMPATFELVLMSLLIAIAIGIPLGIYTGLNKESVLGRLVLRGSVLGYSLPAFWQGMMLILAFSVMLHWLPASGRGETRDIAGIPFSFLTLDGLRHLLLPAFNLAIPNIALLLRLTASGTSNARSAEYVKFARAKGIRPKRIIRRHILRNILVPIVTIIGVEFGSLIAYSTITETVFAWPGMGKLLIDSIYLLDRPVVVAYVMVATLLFVMINLLVDILYAVLDPRVQLGGGAR